MDAKLLIYFTPLIFLVFWQARRRARSEAANAIALEENRQAGLTEPASLHPVIDGGKCIGCGSCVSACPEGNVLGLINGKAKLIHPTHCIGHGACKDACPLHAISLVFGTETRGVDIPHVGTDFQTNMPGIYIAGELGGMGLIRNAVEQGRQALENIRKSLSHSAARSDVLDLVIVGAGPAGFSASLGAMQHKLKFVTLEQETLGGTVAHFPRGKLVMTAPVQLPLVGKVRFTETTKEELLGFWQQVEKSTGLAVRYQERVDDISAENGIYTVTTSKNTYRTRAVLLSIGRRGTPRKLGVPGEELDKVVYRLIDPEQYRGKHVLVVGGGDSALEAASSIAAEPGTTVTLSYRSGAFSRAKQKNRDKIEQAEAQGRLKVVFNSNVTAIEAERVRLEQEGTPLEIVNDAVIVSAGGVLPTPFLKRIGIEVETRHGSA